MADDVRKRPMTTYGSRYAKRERNVESDESSSSSDSEIDVEQIKMMREEHSEHLLKPVKGEPGLAYKVQAKHLLDMSQFKEKCHIY